MSDDVELASSIFEAAASVKDQPNLRILLYENASSLGSRGPEGHETALQSLRKTFPTAHGVVATTRYEAADNAVAAGFDEIDAIAIGNADLPFRGSHICEVPWFASVVASGLKPSSVNHDSPSARARLSLRTTGVFQGFIGSSFLPCSLAMIPAAARTMTLWL